MKKTLKLLVLVVAIFASINLFANESSSTDPLKTVKNAKDQTVFVERNDKVYIVLDNPERSSVHIEVRDAIDRLVYSETFKDKEEVKKAFNFSKAYAGSYHITVNNGSTVFYKSVEI